MTKTETELKREIEKWRKELAPHQYELLSRARYNEDKLVKEACGLVGLELILEAYKKRVRKKRR
jgi:hypothetical protein